MAYTEQEIRDLLFERERNNAALKMGMPLSGNSGRKMQQLSMLNQSGNIGSMDELDAAIPDEQAYQNVDRAGEVIPKKKKMQQNYLMDPSRYTSRMMSGLGNGYNYGGFNYGN